MEFFAFGLEFLVIKEEKIIVVIFRPTSKIYINILKEYKNEFK